MEARAASVSTCRHVYPRKRRRSRSESRNIRDVSRVTRAKILRWSGPALILIGLGLLAFAYLSEPSATGAPATRADYAVVVQESGGAARPVTLDTDDGALIELEPGDRLTVEVKLGRRRPEVRRAYLLIEKAPKGRQNLLVAALSDEIHQRAASGRSWRGLMSGEEADLYPVEVELTTDAVRIALLAESTWLADAEATYLLRLALSDKAWKARMLASSLEQNTVEQPGATLWTIPPLRIRAGQLDEVDSALSDEVGEAGPDVEGEDDGVGAPDELINEAP